MRMNKQKKGLFPELRFPEFEKEPNWPCVKLNTVAKRSTSKNKGEKITRVLTNSAVDGVVDQRDYFDKDIAVKGNLESYYIVDKGDYVYNPRISSTAPVGPISKNKVGKGVMSPLYTVFRFNSKINDFFEQFFKSSRWYGYLQTISNSGARHDRMSITSGEFMAMPVPNPSELEQQKIADCLASIDELITLHTRKLDALKDYKKGLMQQFFPAEGETLPKLRFPEFGECGKWERKLISSVAQITTGGKDTQNKIEDGKYPFFVRSQTIERINSYSFDGEAVLTSGDGVGVGKIYHYINGKFDFHQRVYCIYDFSEEVSGKFFYLYFSEHFYRRVMRLSAKNSVDSVRMAMIADMEILLPKKDEQRKIVDAVFSLQEIIDRQEVKVDSLKEHKKGLVQKIFPAMDETI
jgi:type I restriction enzyme S subunit